MRRLSERARLEGMLALRKALEGVRRKQTSLAATNGDDLRASFAYRSVDDSTWWRRAEATADDAQSGPEPLPAALLADINLDVAKSLDRIADSIERIGAQLDSYHSERAEHLDAIEFLLREMVIGTVQPAAGRSIVMGGVVDPDELAHDELTHDEIAHDDGITIVPDGFPLEPETAVEVRSRFHDRWIAGFSIAEAVDEPGRFRYRLTRRSDGIPLPILFEACDVRAVSNVSERKITSASRLS
jgi:hypothetical protein